MRSFANTRKKRAWLDAPPKKEITKTDTLAGSIENAKDFAIGNIPRLAAYERARRALRRECEPWTDRLYSLRATRALALGRFAPMQIERFALTEQSALARLNASIQTRLRLIM